MTFRFSSSSLVRRANVDKRLIEISDLAIKISVVDFGVPQYGGIRTAEAQRDLYDANKSNCDGTVKLSNHQTGKALDVYAYVDGKASWDRYDLSMVAAAMLQAASVLGYKLKWGGLWTKFKDYPHFELVD